MEPLKYVSLKELLIIEEILDENFYEKKTVRKRELQRIRIAYYMKLGEVFKELEGEWNYLKKSTKPFDKNKLLKELSDCLHFLLSYTNEKGISGSTVFSNHSNKTLVIPLTTLDLDELLKSLFVNFMDEEYYKVLVDITTLVYWSGSTMEEFLEVYHRVWGRNMGERTSIDY